MELSPRGNSGCADILPPTFVATLEWTEEEWRNDCDLKFMHNMTLIIYICVYKNEHSSMKSYNM